MSEWNSNLWNERKSEGQELERRSGRPSKTQTDAESEWLRTLGAGSRKEEDRNKITKGSPRHPVTLFLLVKQETLYLKSLASAKAQRGRWTLRDPRREDKGGHTSPSQTPSSHLLPSKGCCCSPAAEHCLGFKRQGEVHFLVLPQTTTK
jgi:hypothetical protein